MNMKMTKTKAFTRRLNAAGRAPHGCRFCKYYPLLPDGNLTAQEAYKHLSVNDYVSIFFRRSKWLLDPLCRWCGRGNLFSVKLSFRRLP